MSTTPNMNLIVPDVGATSGPSYATQLNTALDVVDAHDHTPGKGARIPPSGLNINADLPFNSNDAVSLRSTRYVAQTGVLAAADDRNCISSVNGNLYWNNANGVAVQITAGNGLNFASLGTIGGDYGAAGVTASAVYTDSLKTFSWLQAASQYAKMGMADLSLYSTTASTLAVTLKANAATAAYDFVMPVAAPAANTIMRMALGGQGSFVSLNGTANQITVTPNTSDITFSIPSNAILPGNVSATGSLSSGTTITAGTSISSATTITAGTGFFGAGAVPIGGIIAIGDAGAWALPASGAIKDGWALCNGQAKPVGSAAGLAANLPDLTDDRFLNGSSSVGGTGGSASKTTTGISATFQKSVMNTDQTAHFHKLPYLQITTSGGTGLTYGYVTAAASGSSWYGTSSDSGNKWAVVSSSSTVVNTGTTDVVNSSSETISWLSSTVVTSVTQGTISDIRPKYFNVVYLMRVA